MKPLAPKRPVWFSVSVGIGALGLLGAIWLRTRRAWDPGDLRSGLAFGIAAAALVLSQAFYPLRRRLMSFPFGTAQRWVQFHIYGGALAFLFVLIHQGFRWPSGALGWILLILSFWATASGLSWVWLEKWIPVMLASGLQVEAIFERIPDLVERLRREAAALVEGSSEAFDRFYRDDVEPGLAGVNASWDYLRDVRGGRDRRLAVFDRMARFLAEEERPRLEDLKTIFTQKLELDAHYSVQRVLRLWAYVHIPPSILLIGFLMFHIAMGIYYR